MNRAEGLQERKYFTVVSFEQGAELGRTERAVGPNPVWNHKIVG